MDTPANSGFFASRAQDKAETIELLQRLDIKENRFLCLGYKPIVDVLSKMSTQSLRKWVENVHVVTWPMSLQPRLRRNYVGIKLDSQRSSEIKPLQGRDDWIEWNEELQGQLVMIDPYVILADPTHEPSSKET